jgi:3,4-dihydroxy-9,10-secoandrosta-1,3,5(10)-triene-9,17-dione 4,5-dioxygenase
MGKVIAYGYLGVTAPDLNEWRSFATDVLGVALGPGSDDNKVYLRTDERAWRVSVEPGDGGLAFCGWEVANAVQLEALAKDLDAAGIAYKEDKQLAAERQVNGLITCTDPGGNQIEFFYGAYIPQAPFVSPTGMRFVTSDKGPGDMGYGHTVISFPDLAEAKHFYLDVLGFRLSDTISFEPMPGHTVTATFTHVNPRHHSLAFVEIPGAPSALNHFMLEVENIDMVGRTLDRVNEREIEIVSTLGKHTNDHMVSFYMKSPSGFAIEFGTGGRRIDDNVWITSKYDAASYWGHHRVAVPVTA